MKSEQKKMFIIASAIIVVLLGVIGILGWKLQAKDMPAQAEATTARVLGKVEKLYLLPTDEQPTMAQVQDKKQLDDKELFKRAENGDYILLYKKNKLGLVYRESINKVVTAGPISIDESE